MQTHAQRSNVRKYLSEKKWNELFPNRIGIDPAHASKTAIDFYSYKSFLAAADSFPQFLSNPDPVIQKRELCAFLANIAKETGGGWDDAPGGYYKWGLRYTEELNCVKGCPQYSDPSKKNYPPVAGQSYHGRGPIQISWNYNYGQFSEAYFKNKNVLLNDPSLITKNAQLAFASALWFWTTPQFPKPSCHEVMSGTWQPSPKDIDGGRLPGFGTVVNVINGGIDCGPSGDPDTKYRYGYYLFFCRYFNVTPGDNVECSNQKPFGS
ncbi:chitinase [Sediminibacterium roseum]|uniref:Chitinase n=1 Tax=Sediminibacterium roseum TaxID=1978412 RepID=A0ABX0A1A9_9BACT|nr:chitinase [Sediminibacterium roseum]